MTSFYFEGVSVGKRRRSMMLVSTVRVWHDDWNWNWNWNAK